MITIETKGIKEVLKSLDPFIVRRAAASAINRTGKKVVTAADRSIRGHYSIKRMYVRPNIRIARHASPKSLRAIVMPEGRRIPLIRFGARVRKITARARRKGTPSVKVRVKRTSALRPLPHAFQATMSSGHVGIYRRLGKPRLPIRELFGPSVPQMFKSDEVQRDLKLKIDEEFPVEFERRLGWEMRKRGK